MAAMHSTAIRSTILAAVLVTSCSRCSETSQTPARDGTSDDGTPAGDGSATGDGGPATDGLRPDGRPLRPEDVVPERLPAQAATDCPGAYATRAPAAGQNTGFAAAGQQRSFYLALPPGSFSGPRPLLFGWHGTSEKAQGFYGRADLADFVARGFIVVAPDTSGNGTLWPIWDAMRKPGDAARTNADLALFDALVQCVAAHHPVDRHRIYVTGHSAGGIMTNHVLQHRSALLAGGVPASGLWSWTGPQPTQAMQGTLAVVTWGGDRDQWAGTAGGISVTFNFAEQASLASRHYHGQPAVGHVRCSADLGHAWLPINDWLIDLLLAHPKGISGAGGITFPMPAGSGVTCTPDPYVYQPPVQVSCPSSAVDGCQQACQLVGDCGVENGTLSTVLAHQFAGLGFSGAHNGDCSGCVANCAGAQLSVADRQVLACLKTAQQQGTCGPGLEGAVPLINGINQCCLGRDESELCGQLCETILDNSAAGQIFTTCVSLN
jgi:poly(3-hydroxybutyrate) depolymerase